MRVLFFKLSPIGDTVMFLPVVQALRRLRPSWKLTVCTTPICASLFRSCLDEADIWVEDRTKLQKIWRRPVALFDWLRRVRKLKPDSVLLSFDQSSMARVLAVASGAKVRIGGAESAVRWRHGLTHEVAISQGHSLAEWDWEMARSLANISNLEWPAQPAPPRLAAKRTFARGARPRVLIHCGASSAYKIWAIDRYARLAERLAIDCEVIWVRYPGGPSEMPKVPVVSAAPKNLDAFVSLAVSSDLFVGNHSGPFHLASAAGTPCVIPTGPTLSACDPPWAAEQTRFLRMRGLACMPCDKLTVSPNRCTNTRTPMACLNYWTVEAVEGVCRELLAQRGAVS